MTTRYEQLNEVVRMVMPRTPDYLSIVEVGVHRGLRAELMVTAALGRVQRVHYLGFDVFETMPQAFHDEALNGKGIASQAEAEGRLRGIERTFRHRFGWLLQVGDTRETLHDAPVECDLAFIDGDHRVEVIRGDAKACTHGLLVFDDYYRPGPDGRCPDLTIHGANAVVDEYLADGARVAIMPRGDLCKHGGIAFLAVVRR